MNDAIDSMPPAARPPTPKRVSTALPRGLAKGLAWVSLGVGATQLVMPTALTGLLGLGSRRSTRTMVRWLGAGMLLGSVAALGGVQYAQAKSEGGLRVTRSVTIRRKPTDVHAVLRELVQEAQFLRFPTPDAIARATATKEPVAEDPTPDWLADIETPTLYWRAPAVSGFDGEASIEVRAAPGDRGTELVVRLQQAAGPGALQAVRKLFGKHPEQQLARRLAQLKQVLETGASARSDASIHTGPHPAQPSAPTTPEEIRT